MNQMNDVSMYFTLYAHTQYTIVNQTKETGFSPSIVVLKYDKQLIFGNFSVNGYSQFDKVIIRLIIIKQCVKL